MILLRASQEPGLLERLKSELEAEGIPCEMRNIFTSGLSPEVPITDTTPELWLVRDEQLEQARRILRDLQSGPPTNGPAWTCPQCEEALEPQFSSCWKCGALRPQ
ncbi:MAG: DUF2007 domain-containing protein [Limisphaerales bacterium]